MFISDIRGRKAGQFCAYKIGYKIQALGSTVGISGDYIPELKGKGDVEMLDLLFNLLSFFLTSGKVEGGLENAMVTRQMLNRVSFVHHPPVLNFFNRRH